jgi:hypothetical protein
MAEYGEKEFGLRLPFMGSGNAPRILYPFG